MGNMIKVGMADLNIAKFPNTLTTLGLGSCVGIALYDPVSKIGGLAHIMLPDSTQVKNNLNKAKFADTAIIELIHSMLDAGARKSSIVAKLAGGAQMFSLLSPLSDVMRIGYRNVASCREILNGMSIPIIAEDTGGIHGRTVELHTGNGTLTIKTIGYGIKQV